MNPPFPFADESRVFGDALLKLTHRAQKEKISQYVSKENMHRFHHGDGWLLVRESETDESILEESGFELSVNYDDIARNNAQCLFDFMNKFIEDFAAQAISGMFKTVNETCEKSGNVVNQSDFQSRADAFLEMLRTVDFYVNEQGQVELPQLHLPAGHGSSLFDELSAQGEEFHKEVERIKAEKSKKALTLEKERRSKFKGVAL